MGQVEKSPPVFPKETYKREHGIYRWQLSSGNKVTALSAQTWQAFSSLLRRITIEDEIIVSPELMTFAGQPLETVLDTKEDIQGRVSEVLTFSKKFPNSFFLLGTPTFDKSEKPKNSVVFIKNGVVIGSTSKRSGATEEERSNFSFVANEPPALVPGTKLGLLICSDVSTASISFNEDTQRLKRVLELSHKDNLIGIKPTLIDPVAEDLIVPSCWGVGGNLNWMRGFDPDDYYRLQLRNISFYVFSQHNTLREIVIIDRVPLMEEWLQRFTPDKPYNALLQRL